MSSARVSIAACFLLPLGGVFVTGCPQSDSSGGTGGAGTGGRGTGGATGSGGATGTGGAIGSGGATGTGGRGSGGATGTGGTTGSGGTTGTGGMTGTGGTTGSGGASGGRGGSGTGGGAGGTSTAGFTCPPGPYPAPVLTGLTPAKVTAVPPKDTFNNNGNNFSIIEGPVWVGDVLYISEIASGNSPPPSRILKVTTAGAVTIAIDNAGTNGLALDGTGNLVGGNHKDGAITRFGMAPFSASPIVAMHGSMRFNSPNDLTFRADGNLYFTDPDYQAPTTRPQARTRIYRLAPGTTAATVVDENRGQPNGATLSPDGNTLYVTGNDGLFKYPVAANGTVGTGAKIVQSIGGGDGMAVDCGGNIYVSTNNTVVVVSPTDTVIGTITVTGAQSVTNAAFGGADHKTLYITALGSGTQNGLFTAAMNVPGYPY